MVKAAPGPKGSHPRSGVTPWPGNPHRLYRDQDWARGALDKRLKAQPLDLFADRTSGPPWGPTPFRRLLSRGAYVLVRARHRRGVAGPALATAAVSPRRLTLFNGGASG